MTTEELETLTNATASKSQSVSVDGQTVTRQSVESLIALENHRAKQSMAGRSFGGIQFVTLIPPGGGGH